jgi:hypothetical protein
MADDDKSFLLVLRDAAKDCPDPIVREAPKLRADRLDALIGNLNDTSTMNDSGSAEEVKLARAA